MIELIAIVGGLLVFIVYPGYPAFLEFCARKGNLILWLGNKVSRKYTIVEREPPQKWYPMMWK